MSAEPAPGLDGLTIETLRASRDAWWDDAFTRRLLAQLPPDPRLVVDVGSGLGRAAHALLPHLPATRYLGIDADPARVAEASRELAAAPYAARAESRVGTAEALPVEAASADAVVFVMTLQHLPDVAAALREAIRALRPGGRVVAAEPDNLGQRFYLDGAVEPLTAAIHALAARARSARLPADIAIGPRVASLLAEAGLADVRAAVHAVHATRIEPGEAFLDRVDRLARTIAAQGGLPADAPERIACERAIDAARAALPPRPVATSHVVVPVFVTVGTRP